MTFSGKVVIVTGASSGIGAAAAKQFTKEGAQVAMVGRNETKLKNVSEQCEKAGSKPLVIKADISYDVEAKRVIDETIKKYGKLDVLVNNAGGISTYGSIADGKMVESYDNIMKTNVRAAINLTSLAAPHIIKTKGNIVNITSVGGQITPMSPSLLAYNVSKAALDHFTRCVALELAASGVRVNAVSPGPVLTDFMENSGLQGDIKSLGSIVALKRISDPEEIADVITFLASDKAKGITGSVYVTDNGLLLGMDTSSLNVGLE